MPQIGTHTTRNTSAVSTCPCGNLDHYRNVVHEWLTSIFVYISFLSLFCCIKLSVRVCTLTSIPRISTGLRVGVDSSQITSNCKTWLESNNIFKDVLNTEIDNHADTQCFGKNFRQLNLSNLMCSVSPILSEYSTTDEIEIFTAAIPVKYTYYYL